MSLVKRWRDRVFWGAHSVTWDSGAPDEVRSHRALDVVGWVRALGVPDGGAVLDLGCATGELSVALSRAGFEVVGVDVSRAMLRRARRKAQGLDRAPVFRLADLNQQLPVRGESFDCVLCANALQCVEEPALLLREARRVLVRGGRLALVGKVPGAGPSSPPSAAVGARLFAPIKAWASRWARHLPEAALRELAERAGFLDVTARSTGDKLEVSGRAP
jgi:SAM-dependent methyltransferase